MSNLLLPYLQLETLYGLVGHIELHLERDLDLPHERHFHHLDVSCTHRLGSLCLNGLLPLFQSLSQVLHLRLRLRLVLLALRSLLQTSSRQICILLLQLLIMFLKLLVHLLQPSELVFRGNELFLVLLDDGLLILV